MTAFLIDMDGVLYRGDRVIPGAQAFLESIHAFPHVFLTNNSSQPPEFFRTRMQGLGLPVADDAPLITSAMATARYLANTQPGFRYFAVGGQGLRLALGQVGVPADDYVDFVVVGEGPGLDYDSLIQGGNLLLDGARLIATNPDANVDHGDFVLPGGGALLAPFEVMSGQRARVIGKPEAPLFEAGLAALTTMGETGLAATQTIMVGDRPDTDILGASRLGMQTLLVRTGRFGPDDTYPDSLPRPTWDVADLRDWLPTLQSLASS